MQLATVTNITELNLFYFRDKRFAKYNRQYLLNRYNNLYTRKFFNTLNIENFFKRDGTVPRSVKSRPDLNKNFDTEFIMGLFNRKKRYKKRSNSKLNINNNRPFRAISGRGLGGNKRL